jgi:tetratricopeptide (TPR) repeat protein
VSKGYRIASLDEIEIPQLVNSPRWSMVRRHFDIGSFGINAWRADETGQDVIAEHDESSGGAAGHEELYVVLDGKAEFTVDGESFAGTPGAIVFVRDPSLKRRAVAAEPGTRILAIGAVRGEPFTPSTWERSAPAFPHFLSGDHAKAAEVLEEALAEWPDDPALLYNLACARAQTGEIDAALDHLGRVFELDAANGRFRELAAKDTDFDPLRDDPRFAELVG